MQKILVWFRGEKSTDYDGADTTTGALSSGGQRRWRSSLIARTSRRHKHNKNGKDGGGGAMANEGENGGFVGKFDAIANASTSSPAILSAPSKRSGKSAKQQQQQQQNATEDYNNDHQQHSDRHRQKEGRISRGAKSERQNGHRHKHNKKNEATADEQPRLKISTSFQQPSSGKKVTADDGGGTTFPSERRGSTRKYGVALPAGFAISTEDIPDSRTGPKFDVNKKAVSANEAIGVGKRPSILQKLRLRLRTKGGSKKEREMPLEQQQQHHHLLVPALAREELRMETLAIMARATMEEVKGEKKRSRKLYEKLDGRVSAEGATRREHLQQQRQRSEDFDAFSQGRNSSFDYFSATASPTDQPADQQLDDEQPQQLDDDELAVENNRNRRGAEKHGEAAAEEEELRFATAAEARAYLRRQKAAERGGGVVDNDELTAGEEEMAFDADDEISNRLTASNNGDSICQLQRPHSALSTSTTGRHHQRESIYFTVVQPGVVAAVIGGNVGGGHSAPSSPPQHQQQKAPEPHKQVKKLLHKQLSRSQILNKRDSEDSLVEVAERRGSDETTAKAGGGGGGGNSVPNSTRTDRRRLRFVIPQVSICSAADNDDDAFDGIEPEDEANNNTTTLSPNILLNNNNNNELLDDEQNNNLMASATAASGGGGIGIQSTSSSSTCASGTTNAATQSNNNMLPPLLPSMFGMPGTPEAELQLKRALTQMDKKQLTLAQRRQSNMDFVHQASGRRTSTTLIPLTAAQIHLIRSLWRQVYLSKGPTVIGSQISHRLFFKEPQLREQFRRCPLPQQHVNHDSFSKAHCRQISEMIDQVVESLDDLEGVAPMLERVGRAHARVSGGQLSSKLWNAVAETFIDCTLEWGDRRARSETVRKAWALIIAYMIERIKHGHLEERRQITAIRSTIASLERFAVNPPPAPDAQYIQQQQQEQQQQSVPTTPGMMDNNSQQQQQQQQLALPGAGGNGMCPIRRVSATATLANGVRTTAVASNFSPDDFRSMNAVGAGVTAYIGGTTMPTAANSGTTTFSAAGIVSPVSSRRRMPNNNGGGNCSTGTVRVLPSPRASPRNGRRTQSDAKRPPIMPLLAAQHNNMSPPSPLCTASLSRKRSGAGSKEDMQRQPEHTDV